MTQINRIIIAVHMAECLHICVIFLLYNSSEISYYLGSFISIMFNAGKVNLYIFQTEVLFRSNLMLFRTACTYTSLSETNLSLQYEANLSSYHQIIP